jgi:hypothetical protein
MTRHARHVADRSTVTFHSTELPIRTHVHDFTHTVLRTGFDYR